MAPLRRSLRIMRRHSVAATRPFPSRENTEAGEDIGSPITASDPEDDDLTYSLTGTDAASFDIDPSTGQILTDGALDYETKDTYHLAVSVS